MIDLQQMEVGMTGRISRRGLVQLVAGAAATGPLASSLAFGAETPKALQSGIQEVVVSVFDIDQLARPMTESGDFVRIDLPDAPKEQWAAWHVPAGCTRIQQTLLRHSGSEAGRGSLKLVKFHSVEQKVMRSSQRSWDTGGIFDVDVSVTDAKGVYHKLQMHGWTALGDPVEYTESGLHVHQVVAEGPNGFMLAMIEHHEPAYSGPPFKGMSAIHNSTQMVADLDKALDFYTRVLGWGMRMRFDITHQAEPGADVLGLPQPQADTAVRRLAMTRSDDGPAPAHVELIENRTMRGRDFSKDCVAPNVGILCLRMPVKDAAGYAKAIQGRGGQLYSEPQSLDIAPYGHVTLFSIRSPEGAILEFYTKA
jgi:predicted enzyme related to lactoylglutathione lyase